MSAGKFSTTIGRQTNAPQTVSRTGIEAAIITAQVSTQAYGSGAAARNGNKQK